MQKKLMIIPLLLLLFLAACTSQTEPAAEQIEGVQEQPQQNEAPEVAPEVAPNEAPVGNEDETVQQVSTRPQLVEFYADW